MREMKDSGIEWIGEIPQNWKVRKIKYNFRRNELNNPGNLPVLSVYREYGVIPKDSRDDNHNVTSEDTSKYKYVHIGNLVINKMKAWQGSMGVSDYTGIVSPAYYIYEINEDEIYRRYAHILLRNVYKDEFRRISSGIREGQWDLPANGFENIYIILPSFVEQQRIADFLDEKCAEINNLASDIEKQIEILEKYKKSVISETVTKGLDPDVEMKDSGIEWIGDIPQAWDTIKIGHIFSLRNDKNTLPEDKVQLLSLYTGIGVFPTGSEYTKASGNHAQTVEGYKIVKKNDIVVNIILAWMGALGISDYDGVVSPAYDVYIPNMEKIIPHYFHYVFRTSGIAGECYKYGRGIMLMRWRTYSSEFRQIQVPYPSLIEQKKIADYLDEKCNEIDILIKNKQKQLKTLEQYKKSLIYEYVTGKKEVP